MAVDKVNIEALYTLFPENLRGLEGGDMNQVLRGTDLYFLEQDKLSGGVKLGTVGHPDEVTSLQFEAAQVNFLRRADTNKDKYLDMAEIRKILYEKGYAGKTYPEQYLKGVEYLVQQRYGKMLENVKRLDGELGHRPLLDLLHTYNDGLYQEDMRHAKAAISYTGLTKTATNIVMFLPSAAYNIFGDAPMLLGDAGAEAQGQIAYANRTEAIRLLKLTFEKGLAENEPWALESNLIEALKRMDPDQAEIISRQLAGKEIYKIIAEQDESKRYRMLEDFADRERPGFLGFGGGNTTDRTLWNYFGRRANLFFAQSIYQFLASKELKGNQKTSEALQDRAVGKISDMTGDGGAGYSNLFMVGATNVFCLGGWVCEPTPYRDWGDAEAMNALGRGVNGVLMGFGGFKGYQAWKSVWRLRKFRGFRGVGQVIKNEGRWYKPIPVKALNREAKLAEEAGLAAEGSKKLGRLGRLWQGIKDKTVGRLPLPKLSESQAATLSTLGAKANAGGDKLMTGLLIAYTVTKGDEAQRIVYNPFEADYEMNPDPWPSLQKCNSFYYPKGCPQPKTP